MGEIGWKYPRPTQPQSPGDSAQPAGDVSGYYSGDYFQDPEYQRLLNEFRGAFGSSFNTFSWEQFNADPEYSQRIYNQIGGENGPAKQMALQNLKDYFQNRTEGGIFEKSGGQIDVASLFSPLKSSVSELAAQARQSGMANISRQAAGAQRRATESLAGTGLGRSGAAAGGFAAIENQRTSAVDRLLERVQGYEMQAKLDIDRKIADLQMSEELRKRGMKADEIAQTLAFNRSLYSMQFGNLLQESADAQKDFWDTWGSLIPSAIQAAGAIAAA